MAHEDEREFEAFVHALTGPLFRTALLMVGDRGLAEDLLQTAFTKVYLRWRRVRDLAEPGAYARRILVNEALSWRRRRWSTELPLSALDGEEPSRDLAAAASVWNAVLTLPPRQRAVVVLRYYEDLTEPQIADVLGIAVGTVKSTLHAATQRLGVLLDDRTPAGEGRPS